MQGLLDIYGFLAVGLRGLTLSFEALTVGGVFFLWLVLRGPAAEVERDCRLLLRRVAIVLIAVAILSAGLNATVLRLSAGDFSWMDALNTSFVWSGSCAVASALTICVLAKRYSPAAMVLPALGIVCGALLTSHAFGRIADRPFLLAVTATHHLASAAWIGGLPYLLVCVARGDERTKSFTVPRFSRVAVISVVALLLAGAAMAWRYVGTASAAYGTSYGVMLGAKIALTIMLLVLGASNFLLLRRSHHPTIAGWLRMRRTVEVEAIVGIVAILTAASLTSQPPAVDLAEGRVTAREIVERFSPRLPRLTTPPLESLSAATPLNDEQSQRFGRPLSFVPGETYEPPKPSDIEWSEYNHNWAGICVLAMGLLALAAQTRWSKWARHWPLAFLGLAIFLLIRADSENWPLGPRGFWESFQVAEVAQHRLFVVLIVAFAIFEWRVAIGRAHRDWYALVFPAVCLVGGALLLTHTHPLGNIKEEMLTELSHTPIALLAVVAGGARWLQLRMPERDSRLGLVWALAFVGIGLMLTFYREG